MCLLFSPASLHSQDSLRMEPSDYEAVASCNCLKDERKRLAVRRYAGVFVVVLPCGHIVTLHHLVGSESLPQVAMCFARALSITPAKRFLCYDNACALARFCRNPVRAAHMVPFHGCQFILPESHARGHTACLNPDHVHYLPEVRKSAHPELAGVNTEAQEQVFAWSRWLVYVANPMTPVRHRVFFLLLSLARNQHRGLGVRPRRQRQRRHWTVWRGAVPSQAADPPPAGVALPEDPPVAGDDAPPEVRADAAQPCLLVNLRDNKLHRLSAPLRIACGATLPKRWRYIASREELPRSKLCLRNGCFSPGAAV